MKHHQAIFAIILLALAIGAMVRFGQITDQIDGKEAATMEGGTGQEGPFIKIMDAGYGVEFVNNTFIFEPTFEDLLDAIEWVESRGDANAVGDNGEAIGAYQLHKIYVDDVNRIWGSNLTYEDRWDKNTSRLITKMYLLHYFPEMPESGFEILARMHNSGPDGWHNEPEWFVRNRGYTLEEAEKKIKNAKAYWLKVKERMNNMATKKEEVKEVTHYFKLGGLLTACGERAEANWVANPSLVTCEKCKERLEQ